MVFTTMTISKIIKNVCFTCVAPSMAGLLIRLPRASSHNIVVLSTMPLHRCLHDTSLYSA